MRVMDVVKIRDRDIEHTGEAAMLACLLKVRGNSKRPRREVEEIGKILNDPNLED